MTTYFAIINKEIAFEADTYFDVANWLVGYYMAHKGETTETMHNFVKTHIVKG